MLSPGFTVATLTITRGRPNPTESTLSPGPSPFSLLILFTMVTSVETAFSLTEFPKCITLFCSGPSLTGWDEFLLGEVLILLGDGQGMDYKYTFQWPPLVVTSRNQTGLEHGWWVQTCPGFRAREVTTLFYLIPSLKRHDATRRERFVCRRSWSSRKHMSKKKKSVKTYFWAFKTNVNIGASISLSRRKVVAVTKRWESSLF